MSEIEMTKAAADVLAERRRQIEAEGWTPEHDDEHSAGEMALAASCYAEEGPQPYGAGWATSPTRWPWSPDWWKPQGYRRNLVKAGALILAEIERLDRARGETRQPFGPNNPPRLRKPGESLADYRAAMGWS